MPIERRNPLPVGSYLWAVFDNLSKDNVSAAQSWIDAHPGQVHVQQDAPISTEGSGATYNLPGHWWYFHTSEPVQWVGPGLPDIATPEALKEYNAIPTENPYLTAVSDAAGDVLEAAEKAAEGVFAFFPVVVVGGLGFLFYKLFKKE